MTDDDQVAALFDKIELVSAGFHPSVRASAYANCIAKIIIETANSEGGAIRGAKAISADITEITRKNWRRVTAK